MESGHFCTKPLTSVGSLVCSIGIKLLVMKCTRFFVGIGVIFRLIICFVSSLISGPDVDVDVPEADIVVAAALPTLETAPQSVDVKGVKLHAPYVCVVYVPAHIP